MGADEHRLLDESVSDLPLHISLLGLMSVSVGTNQHDLRGLGSREKTVLALLALHGGRMVPSRRLLEELWPQGRQPHSAGNAVQVYVSRLRRSLGAHAVRRTALGYVLVGSLTLDVSDFEQLGAAGRRLLHGGDAAAAHAKLASALALWRGEPLTDCGDAPFVNGTRIRLADLRVGFLEDYYEAELLLGAGAGLAADLAAACARYPYRERLAGHLLSALYQAGRREEAVARYRDFRERTVTELGLEPGPWLQRRYQAILQGDPTLVHDVIAGPVLPVVRPPVPTTPLLGREDDLKRLRNMLADPTVRMVSLIGPGGVGKTRLAAQVAQHCCGRDSAWPADRFADGVAWVSLTQAKGHRGLLLAVAHGLGLRQSDDVPLDGLISARLTGRRLLLVLDNLEHLLPDAGATIQHWLSLHGPTVVLVTSRTPVYVAGEHRHRVRPLAVPERCPVAAVNAAMSSPAVALFWSRAIAVEPDLELTRTAADTVVDICRALDGLPLALELAAVRVSVLPLPLLAAQLRQQPVLEDSVAADRSGRHRSVLGTVAWSIGLLTARQRALLARLTVFAGSFSLPELEHVGRGAGIAGSDVWGDLGQLLDVSLVNRCPPTAEEGEPRFELLHVVRAHVEDLLPLAPRERADASRDLAQWLARRCETIARRCPPLPATAAEARWLDAERPNLHSSLTWAREHGERQVLADLTLVACGWTATGDLSEMRRWLEDLATTPPDPRTAAAAIALRAMLSIGMLGAETLAWMRSAVKHAESAGTADWLAVSKAQLVLALTEAESAGATDEAARLVDEALRSARELRRSDVLAFVLCTSSGFFEQTNPRRGEDLLTEAIAMGRGRCEVTVCSAAANLAELRLARGDADGAEKAARFALDLEIAQMTPYLASYAQDHLAVAFLLRGEPGPATTLLSEVLVRADWHGLETLFTEALGHAAVLAYLHGDYPRAGVLVGVMHERTRAAGRKVGAGTKALLRRYPELLACQRSPAHDEDAWLPPDLIAFALPGT